MNARFGIIVGLITAAAGCNDGSSKDLFAQGTAALDCNGDGCTFAGAKKPADEPEPSGYGRGGHADAGYDSDDDDDHGGHGHGYADAGAPCAYDDDCAKGETCERRHGVSYCAPDDHDSHSDDDDYYGNDDPKPETPDADEPRCDGDYGDYCDDDRSGSNSGPH